ncbi:hypothetical protein CAPTEDRAFT_33225, partial [Capitella teleta]
LYLCLLFCGIGLVIPTQIFIIGHPFYQSKFKGHNITEDLETTTTVFSVVGALGGLALIEVFSTKARVLGGFGVSLLAVLFVTVFNLWWDVLSTRVLHISTLVSSGLIAVGTSLAQSSIYGYSTQMPMKYSQAVMMGESECFLTFLLGHFYNLFIFLPPAVGEITMTLFKNVFEGFQLDDFPLNAEVYQITCLMDEETRRLTSSGVSYSTTTGEGESRRSVRDENESAPSSSPEDDTSGSYYVTGSGRVTSIEMMPVGAQDEMRAVWEGDEGAILHRMEVVIELWAYMLGIATIYLVTNSVYPALLLEVHSSELGNHSSTLLLSVWSTFEAIGRGLASLGTSWGGPHLLILAVNRALFADILLLCVIPLGHALLGHIVFAVVCSAVLALTNGQWGTLFMSEGGGQVSDANKEVAGVVLTTSMRMGIGAG